MDPDATLAEIRNLIANYPTSPIEDVDRLVELFNNLDSWLSNGGFMPRGWVVWP